MPHLRPSLLAARFRVVAVPSLLTSALVVGLVGALSTSASADAGSLVIGDAPIQLTQPVDPGVTALAPTSDAPEKGMFGPQIAWPVVPIHAALARNGHLVTFGTPLHDASQNGMVFDDWDPAADDDEASHVDSESMHSYDSFCNSLVGLEDGRLLMVGGNSAMSTMLYDPFTHQEEMGPSVVQQRWYATALRMTDGRVIVLGGGNSYKTPSGSPDEADRVALTPEVGDGVGDWTKLSGATSSELFGLDDGRWWYPRAFNAAGGTVLGISSNRIWRLDPTGSVMHLADLPYDPKVSGSAVMFAPGRVLVAGGGQDNPEDDRIGTARAVVVDVDARTPTVETTGEMQRGRNWLNLTVLPTGEVLANGGTTVGTENGETNSVKQAEIWHPSTGMWTDAATAQRTRTYHSTALLLPSGAVFTGGGGVPGPEDNFNAELYYPASLFDRDADGRVRWASRPTITTISGSATYGGTVSMRIGGDRAVASASLITLPSVTHSESTDQRRVPLVIDQVGDEVHATLPASTDDLPPGDYELTVVDSDGVPSPAQIVTIRKDAPGPPPG